MSSQSSIANFVTLQHHQTISTVSKPVDYTQSSQAEHEVSDGGGTGFILFCMVLVLAAVVWWLI